MTEALQPVFLVLGGVTAGLLVLTLPWRRPRLLLFLLCHLLVASALLRYDRTEAGLVLVIAGAGAALNLFLAGPEAGEREPGDRLGGFGLRLSAGFMVVTVAWGASLSPVWAELGVDSATGFGLAALLGLGLMLLSLSERSLDLGMGLLLAFVGFDLLYLQLEPSLAVLALLGLVHLATSIVAAYLHSLSAPRGGTSEAGP